MEKVTKQVEVSKAADEFVAKLTALVVIAKSALKDGFQAGTDLPVLVIAAAQDLVPAIGQISGVVADSKEDLGAVIKALELGAADILAALKA